MGTVVTDEFLAAVVDVQLKGPCYCLCEQQDTLPLDKEEMAFNVGVGVGVEAPEVFYYSLVAVFLHNRLAAKTTR